MPISSLVLLSDMAAEIVVFSWLASYRQLLREAQAKADEATDPVEKAAHEKLVK